jgi:tRNA (guanosine-2'-O-)-methyltransferase
MHTGSAFSTTRIRSLRPGATRLRDPLTIVYRRKSGQTQSTDTTNTLDWEKFEFSGSPKHDQRFDNPKDFGNAPTPETLAKMSKEEAEIDREYATKLDERQSLLTRLSPEIVAQATQVMEEYVNDERKQRIEQTLSKRTVRSRFLFENPINPSNVWACLRTIDSFGIQKVDVVVDSGTYTGVAALNQKRGMRTAMGSAKWLTLNNYASTVEAVQKVKDQGYLVYASDLSPDSKDVREIDWNAGPICIVMGNEDRGISEEMRSLADATFTLPMVGFAESFNLSVATAITLAHMSAASAKEGEGPLQPGDMDLHERNCLWLKWLLSSMPNHKIAKALLNRANIDLPADINSI